LGGAVNTAFSYAVYLALNNVLSYQISYFIAYALGVAFAYWFNAVFVFQVTLSWKGLFSYPIVYLIQYLTSAFLLAIIVEILGILESLAPLLVAIIMVPVTYVMSKLVLRWTSHRKDRCQDGVAHWVSTEK
jgi:putative flippase GtrA